jgi:hypothetical protein
MWRLTMFEGIKCGFGQEIRIALLLACVFQPTALPAVVAVRYPEGVAHGFLVLRTPDGKALADGESTQVTQGDRVTSEMSFKFTDGSVYEQTTIFSQRGTFRLLKDHVVQKGPQFKPSMETSIDATTGQVTVRYADDHGKEERVLTERLELPPDIANGILFTLLKNVGPSAPQTTVPYVAATPKPRLIHLGDHSTRPGALLDRQLQSQGNTLRGESQSRGTSRNCSAPGGKKPPSIQAWILAERAPAFVRFDGPLHSGGPNWRMELAIPAAWPSSAAKSQQ